MAEPTLDEIWAQTEVDLERIYEALDDPDLTDDEEAFHIEELRLVVERRNLLSNLRKSLS